MKYNYWLVCYSYTIQRHSIQLVAQRGWVLESDWSECEQLFSYNRVVCYPVLPVSGQLQSLILSLWTVWSWGPIFCIFFFSMVLHASVWVLCAMYIWRRLFVQENIEHLCLSKADHSFYVVHLLLCFRMIYMWCVNVKLLWIALATIFLTAAVYFWARGLLLLYYVSRVIYQLKIPTPVPCIWGGIL